MRRSLFVNIKMKGILILVVGPSGSGKGSLVAHLKQTHPEVVFPVSCTTRAPREGEKEGVHFYFVSPEAFDAKAAADEFLEWATYGGNRYGTLKSEIIPALDAGKTVVREVEIQGAEHIIQSLPPENVASIYVDAGSWDNLQKRILARAPMSEAELALRRDRYEKEILFATRADVTIQNSDGGLEQAKEAFVAAVEQLRYNA